MEARGIIEKSHSPWASPVVLVKKPDGTWRFCGDYRKLNAVTTRDVYPLPLIESALTRLQGSTVFTSLDLESVLWQMPLREVDRPKSALTTPDGVWKFKVMPFCLASASACFQRMIDLVLAGLEWTSCLMYIDDVIV